MENLDKYDELLRCRTTTEEEEPILHKQLQPLVRCQENKFVTKMRELGTKRLNLLQDSPFYKLLEMSGDMQDNKAILKLVSMFNTKDRSLRLPDGRCFIVTPEDFTSIMGVEDGDERVIITRENENKNENENENENKKPQRRVFLAANKKQPVVSNEKVLKQLMESKDTNTLKRAFALFALRMIVCAPHRGSLSWTYLKYVDDVSALKKKKWATYAVECLVDSIESFKNSKATTRKYLGGCTIFLLLYVRNKISDTIREEIPEPKRREMIDMKLKEMMASDHTDHSEIFSLVKDKMKLRNEKMIESLGKDQKKCLAKVKNKKAKAFLKKDCEDLICEFKKILDARQENTDYILESLARSEEEIRRRKTIISQKRERENEGEKDTVVAKRKKAAVIKRKKAAVIVRKHSMQTRSREHRNPSADGSC